MSEHLIFHWPHVVWLLTHSLSVLKTESDLLYLYSVRTQNQNPAIPNSSPRPAQPLVTCILSTLMNNRGIRRLGLSVVLTIDPGIHPGFFLSILLTMLTRTYDIPPVKTSSKKPPLICSTKRSCEVKKCNYILYKIN